MRYYIIISLDGVTPIKGHSRNEALEIFSKVYPNDGVVCIMQ